MTKSVLTAAVLALIPASAFAQITVQSTAFVAGATHVDLASIQEGQTATTTAADPAVKNFAQQMVSTHTAANQTLASIVPPTVLPLTTTKSPCLVWQGVLLQQKAWTPYDAAYVQATINNLERLLAVLNGEISAGTEANLKDYAQKRLPEAQAQLAAAKQLQSGHPAPPASVTVHPKFASGQYALTPADQQTLQGIAQKLAGMQQITVTATGYTDNVPIGPELARTGVTTNEILSQRRAESVKQYLISKGVPAGEIQTQGRGAADPVASNGSEDGRAQNRRVTVDATAVAGAGGDLKPIAGVSACND